MPKALDSRLRHFSRILIFCRSPQKLGASDRAVFRRRHDSPMGRRRSFHGVRSLDRSVQLRRCFLRYQSQLLFSFPLFQRFVKKLQGWGLGWDRRELELIYVPSSGASVPRVVCPECTNDREGNFHDLSDHLFVRDFIHLFGNAFMSSFVSSGFPTGLTRFKKASSCFTINPILRCRCAPASGGSR